MTMIASDMSKAQEAAAAEARYHAPRSDDSLAVPLPPFLFSPNTFTHTRPRSIDQSINQSPPPPPSLHPTNTLPRPHRELAAVKVSPDDVAYIVQELEVDKAKAEHRLKQHKGDVVAALRSLLLD